MHATIATGTRATTGTQLIAERCHPTRTHMTNWNGRAAAGRTDRLRGGAATRQTVTAEGRAHSAMSPA